MTDPVPGTPASRSDGHDRDRTPRRRQDPRPTDLVIITGMSGAGRVDRGQRAWRTSAGTSSTTCRRSCIPSHGRAGRATPAAASTRLAAVVDVRSRGFFADLRAALARAARHGHRARGSSSSTPPTRRWSAGSRASAARTRCRARAGCSTASRASATLLRRPARRGRRRHRHLRPQRPPAARQGRRRSSPATAGRALRVDGDVVRLQVRPAAGRRLRRRPALPAQPVLGARAAPARPAGRRRCATTSCARTGAEEFLDRVRRRCWSRWSQGYLREGKRYVTIAVGCTGGKHRVVAIAEALSPAGCSGGDVATILVHRDLGRE